MENEKRLIDANTIPYEEHYVPDGDTQWQYKKELCVLKPTIDALPAVDAVEVVRCKDCTQYRQNPWSKEENMMCMCWCDWLATDPDDFCSFGERREGE
jgi:hypothetical protein